MNHDQIKSISHKLGLFGINQNIEARSAEAVAQSLHPNEFLQLLLEDEAVYRKNRFAKSLLSRAKFRNACELEDWDLSFERGLSKNKIKELAALSFFSNKENLIILGRTGEGKTHLSVAVGRRLCSEGFSTAFLPMNFLFEEILAARSSGKYLGYLKKLCQTKVLVFDDFGLRSYSHEEASSLVDILEERARKGPVIVTSQVDPKGWGRLFEDPIISEAIVDRLTKPSQKITLKGGSYRDRLGQDPGAKNSDLS
jgi:DNA replication protein DnaC